MKRKSSKIREDVKEMLGVDYESDEDFPPYYNVGVLGLSKHGSCIIGQKLLPLLTALQKDSRYSSHDEQLPLNSIMHHHDILGVAIDPVFNYTKSRMKKNKALCTHNMIKDKVRIIHNRRCIESDWIDPEPVEIDLKRLTESA